VVTGIGDGLQACGLRHLRRCCIVAIARLFAIAQRGLAA
jgi:hypothetical protein